MQTGSEPVLPLALLDQRSTLCAGRRIQEGSRSQSDNHESRTTEIGVADVPNYIGLCMDHIVRAASARTILADRKKPPTLKEECHMRIHTCVLRRVTGTLRQNFVINVSVDPPWKHRVLHLLVHGLVKQRRRGFTFYGQS